jgi:hypothetical protein
MPLAIDPPVVFNNKLWVMGHYADGGINGGYGGDIWSSSDGANWTDVDANVPWKDGQPFAEDASPIVFNNKLWVYSASLNDIWSSSDGANWTEIAKAPPWNTGGAVEGIYPIVFNNQLWVVVSLAGWPNPVGGTAWYSSDGVNWTEASISGTVATPVVFGNKLWVEQSGTWYSSSDGTTWTSTQASISSGSVVFNNKLWSVAGNGVWYSTNGTNWTEATSNGPSYPYASYGRTWTYTVAFNNKLWVIEGDYQGGANDIWSSSDGVNWTDGGPFGMWSGRGDSSAVVFNGKMWTMGGFGSLYYSSGEFPLNDVWSSSDGGYWTEATANAPWAARGDASTVVFNNKMWVMGGINSEIGGNGGYHDVWSSSDGANWTEATAGAQWAGRADASTVVFNNKMWIIGGDNFAGFNGPNDAGIIYNDVWSSSDGANWTETDANTPWYGGDAFAHDTIPFVFNNKLWVIGTNISSDLPLYNDIWSSSDGANWTEMTTSTPWSKAPPNGEPPYGQDLTVSIYNNEISVGGGTGGIWTSPDGVNWTEIATGQSVAAGKQPIVTFNNEMWAMGGGPGYGTFYSTIVTPTTCTGPFSFTFTNPTITPGITPIRAVHITELRNDIDSLSADAGLSDYSYADPTITPGVSSIRAVDITDLRTALADVYVACGQSAPTYTDTTLTPGSSLIRAVDITQLRSYVSSAL